MIKDSELFIKKLLESMEEIGKDSFEININNGQFNVATDNGKIDGVVINNNGNNVRNNSIQDKSVKFQNNQKQDYIKIWNSRLFLHRYNDKNSITLAEAFVMPRFSWRNSETRINACNNSLFEEKIKSFIEYNKTSTMLITGVPGIGKTTIVSWISNKYKNNDRFIILRFRDWESEELEKGILNAICYTLNCKKKILNNTVLIIDGFDEMKSLNIRMKLLNNFFNDIKDIKNFKCIITSRPAYIETLKWTTLSRQIF